MANIEAIARKFSDNTQDVQTRLQLVSDIRESIEVVHSGEYKNFLQYLFPAFYNHLRQAPPQFNDGPEQKLRNIILEILNRLPNNELLKPYVQNLLKLCMYLLEVENEENALICLRVIIDLHKNYRPTLEGEVQAFLDVVQKIYSELPKTVQISFKESVTGATAGKLAGPNVSASNNNNVGGDQSKATPLIKSMQSFKVLTECPIIVVLLFQLYPRFVPVNIPKFMPLIVTTLGLQIPPQARMTHRLAYTDFIASQVKTLSFLAYVLRGFAEHLQPYKENIPKCVIQLLLNCPNESASVRKELLIATRHILATDFRVGFVSQIDTLLEEKVLIGTGRTSYETLRPLAYSTLADLIHHVRTDLSLLQISRVIHLYARNIHDTTLPFAIQTMSAKLLLNLVECIARKNDPEGKGRALLVRILDTFVNKFASLKNQIPKLLQNKQGKSYKTTDNIKDCRLLLKTLVLGLKNIVWGIGSCTPSFKSVGSLGSTSNVQPNTVNSASSIKTSTLEESLIFTSLQKNALKCFVIYSQNAGWPVPYPQEEKDILDHFAAIFTMVDAKIFQDVFSVQMPFLYERILENHAILTIPQHFLANPGVSKIFAEILLNFLIERMKNLAGNDKIASSVLLRLFKLVFGSVTIFAENEPVLQPHLATIITSAMKHATEVKDSTNYFVLLRALFRSIGGGKFDQFFKEFLPLLPALLEGLNRLQNSSHSQNMRDLFVELALSVPVRLSALLPCLRLLMRPLVIALDSSNELVLQGLRTLELCIDNLSPEFLDPILAEVKTELLQGLWKHLKPAPNPNGPQVVRILGKLAGRNRRLLLQSPKWKFEEQSTPLVSAPGVDGLVLQLPMTVTADVSNPSVTLSFDRLIQLAKQKLLSSPDLDVKRNSFLFLQTCLNLLLACHLRVENKGSDSTKYATKIKLESEEVILKSLFDSVIVASSNDKLTDIAIPYFEDLNRHFAVMFSNKTGQDILPVSNIFIESLVDGIKSENRTYTKTVLKGIDILIESCSEILGSIELFSTRIQEFDEIAKKLSHCCYKQDWYVKSGGSMGIAHLCTKMPVSWIIRHEVLFTKSLLFILKDLLPEVSVVTIEEASQTLKLVLNVCNSNFVSTDTAQVEQFQEVLNVLSNELTHTNSTVRTNVQKSLHLLSELSRQPISALLDPFKQTILVPIFAKTLRTLPFIIQTGYLDALTFCLKLQPPLLSFNAELVRLLQGALSLAEKDDLASAKTMTQKSMQILNNLRTVSIELLSAAMGCTEFQVAEHQEFRNRIIGVFFKALTLRSKEIVNVAKTGLTQVVSQQKLPKELLQSSLRPVLLNLADYRKLSVPLLQGLSRLLELLTNCFNVTLGEKLLEHLNKWTDPAKIAATKLWKDGEDIKIAACIVEIFHLLPAAASKFLDPLVLLTIQLELQLPREVSSPYRIPLIKFLNRYPTESVDYFLQRLIQPEYSKLFRFLVREESAISLRAELAKKPEKLIAATFHFNIQNTTSLEAQFQGLLLVRTLVKYIPEWLSQNQSVLDCLVEIWKSSARTSRLTNDDNLPLHYLRESKLLIKCFLNYCRFNKQEVDVLFHMLSIFTVRSTIDYTFLREFYTIEVADSYSPQEKKSILLRFLQVFKEPTLNQEHKVQALQILVIPMLTASFAKSETETVDQKIIAAIISILEPKPGEIYEESLNIELLQLATLLVRFMPSDLVEHRKELIKFAWNHLKSEDTTTRHCAYVLVCRFIEAYDTPPKIILQVYVALLRAFQPEAKTLVKQALDVLTPAIYKRLPAGSDAKFPPWIKWTRKIILEEGHSLPQLIHILQLIVRHPQIFYSWRAQFVPHMVNSLARIGLLPNSPHENRKLAVDLAELIISWEKQRLTESEQQKDTESTTNNNNVSSTSADSMDIEGSKTLEQDTASPMDLEDRKDNKEGGNKQAPPISNQEEYKANTTISEMIVNFLIRIASTSTDNTAASSAGAAAAANASTGAPSATSSAVGASTAATTTATGSDLSSGLPQRALELLKSALTLWPDVYIKFAFFEKLLVTATAEQANIVCTGIAILNVIFDYQIHKLVTENLASLQTTLTPSITSTNMKVVTALCALLTKVMKFFPIQGPEIASFYTHISDVLESALASFEKNNISCTLMILKTICEEKPEFLDRYIPSLVRILQKLAKDHIAGGNGQDITIPNTTTPAVATTTAPGTATTTGLSNEAVARMPSSNNINRKFIKDSANTLSQLINTINSRIDHLGEHVKSFLGVLLQLIEKSMDVELLTEVTKKLVSPWVLNNSTIMSTKEKVTFLVKMTRFDQSPNSVLHNSFLELMYHIYSDSSIPKSELQALEGGFIIGLRCKDSTLRNNFFQLFHQSLPTNIMERLLYIFTIQNWESMGTYFWIKQALDLLLSLVSNNSGVIVEFPNVLSKESKDLKYNPGSNNNNNKVKELHSKFVEQLNKSLETTSVIIPTRELFYQDSEIAYQLWVQTFAQIWKLLSKEHQEQFSIVLSNFLCREYHNKQQRSSPNIVQALLDSVLQCTPRPQLPIEVIKYLGKTFNCWHTSVKLLEESMDKEQSTIVPTDLALAELYQLLSEEDLFHTIWKRRLSIPESKVGETLQQHQMWQKSQEVYYDVMNQIQNGTVTNVSVTESTFVESQWIQCAKRLTQWDTLNDIAKSNNYYDLLLESSFKLSDWSTLKDTLPKSTLPSDSPMLKLYQCYLSVHDGKPQELESLINNTTQMALKHLQLYPDIPMQCHIPMLQLFQQIVELKDTSQIIKELNNSNKQQSITDIKALLTTWRERLPNTWEDILVWNDLLTWRQHVYSLITAALAPVADVNPVAFLGQHETAWSINKFSQIARKHGLVEVCLHSLNKIFSLPNIETSDAFAKLKERVKCYFQLPNQLRTGLDIINSANLDIYTSQQKAEFFQLKGEILSKIGMNEEAHSAFSTAVSLYDGLSKAWISWAQFCEAQYRDHKLQQNNEELAWAEYSLNCYMQAIRTQPEKSKKLIPKILHLLSFDDENEKLAKAFDKHSESLPLWIWISYIPQLLSSLARPEAPQMKNILLKLAAMHPQSLFYYLRAFLLEKREKLPISALNAMDTTSTTTPVPTASPAPAPATPTPPTTATATTTPATATGPATPANVPSPAPTATVTGTTPAPTPTPMEEEPTSMANGALPPSTVPLTPTSSTTPVTSSKTRQSDVKYAEEIMACLKATQPGLASDLESLVYQITTSLTPEPHELLSSVLSELLIKCYRLPLCLSKEVPEEIIDIMETICQFTFLRTSSSEQISTIKKYTDFVNENKSKLEEEFLKETNMTKFMEKLKSWISKLNLIDNSSDKTNKIYLEDSSPYLVEFQNNATEIPGQYCQDSEPSPDNHIRIDRFSSEVLLSSKSSVFQGIRKRTLQIRGNNGKLYSFQVDTIPNIPPLFEDGKIDERMSQLLRTLNRFIEKHKETRRRNVTLNTPVIIPLGGRMRLIQQENTYVSLADVYANYCNMLDVNDPFSPLEFTRQQLSTLNNNPEMQLQLYSDILKQIPDNMLTKYISSNMLSCSQYFVYKKQFITQLSITSIIGYILGVTNRSAYNIHFSRTSGCVQQSQFHPNFNEDRMIQFDDNMPFRLTRNLTNFMGEIHLEGVYSSVMSSAALCFSHYKDQIKDHLTLFLREDYLDWQSSDELLYSETDKDKSMDIEVKKKVLDAVEMNVNNILEKIGSLEPQPVYSPEDKHLYAIPVNKRVTELIEAAQNPASIAQTDPTWLNFI